MQWNNIIYMNLLDIREGANIPGSATNKLQK